MIHKLSLLIPLFSIVLLPSCVTVQEDMNELTQSEVQIIDFPQKKNLVAFGTFHSSSIIVERTDVPKRIIPQMHRSDKGIEYYDFGEDHGFFYANQRFLIGGFWYPSWPLSTLYLFLEREGNFTINYRGIPITFIADGSWRPALLWRAVYRDVRKGTTQRNSSGIRPVYSPHRVRAAPKVHSVNKYQNLAFEELLIGPDHLVFRYDEDHAYLSVKEAESVQKSVDDHSKTKVQNAKPPEVRLRPGIKIQITPDRKILVNE